MKKKILLFVLAFAMILTSLSTFVFADEPAGEEEPPAGFVCTCPACKGEEAGLRSDAEITECQGEKYLNIAPSAKIVEVQNTHWHFSHGISPINRLTDGDWHYGVLSPSGTPWQKFSMAFEESNSVDKIVLVLDNWGQGTNSGGATYTPTNTNLDQRGDYTMKVSVFTKDSEGVETQYGTTSEYTINKTTPVLEIELDDVNVSKITFEYGRNSEWVITKVIWEIEVWSNQTFHNWTLDNDAIVTAPTCTTEGVGGYTCNCGATLANATIPATGHNPSGEWVIEPAVPGVPAVEDDPATPEDETAAEVPAVPEKCYQKCANDGCTEKLDYGTHSYSSECDLACNKCSTTRETSVAHTYAAECATKCFACQEARETTVAHTYDHDCDTDCNACLETRETAHKYTDCADTECDSVNAEDPTIKCGFVRTDAPGHDYANNCDQDCSNCATPNPDYAPGHSYVNDCDTDCEVCGATRTIEHKYDNACDTTCNVEGCGAVREVPAHVYDNACDATCNACGATREVPAHVYDNNCDNECNVCGAANANFAEHVYGEEFEKSEDGFKVFTCTVCGYKNVTTEKAGLSGGAIAGIVIGSIAVVAIAAYAAYYFLVVKKKG